MAGALESGRWGMRGDDIQCPTAWAWAAAFLVIVVADLAMMYVPAFTATAGWVVILAARAAAAWFTAWLPKAAER